VLGEPGDTENYSWGGFVRYYGSVSAPGALHRNLNPVLIALLSVGAMSRGRN
jgi:hypothetical protein